MRFLEGDKNLDLKSRFSKSRGLIRPMKIKHFSKDTGCTVGAWLLKQFKFLFNYGLADVKLTEDLYIGSDE